MNNVEINNKRDELDKLINEDAPYSEIYRVSVELDELIERFYGIGK